MRKSRNILSTLNSVTRISLFLGLLGYAIIFF